MKACREKGDSDTHVEWAEGGRRAREGALWGGAGEASTPRATETSGDNHAQELLVGRRQQGSEWEKSHWERSPGGLQEPSQEIIEA